MKQGHRVVGGFSAFLMVLCFGISAVRADDLEVRKKLDGLLVYVSQRSTANIELVKKAVGVLEGEGTGVSLDQQAKDPELKYEILIWASQAYYWLGTHMGTIHDLPINGVRDVDPEELDSNDREARKNFFQMGKSRAKAAQDVNTNYADGYYFYALNLGQWGETNGVISSLMHLHDLKSNLKLMRQKNARVNSKDGQTVSGNAMDGNGADRIEGMMVLKLFQNHYPTAKLDDAVALLKKAHEDSPTFGLNTYYYTLALREAGKEDDACKLLDELKGRDKSYFAVSRLPESLESQELAREERP